MNTAKILITGATGDTGGYAIEQLLQNGRQVRALVHHRDDRSKRLEDRGVEVVAGDYLDLDAMRAAVQGVRRAYFVYPIRPGIIQATAYLAQAAKEAGVEAVVNMSQISAREVRVALVEPACVEGMTQDHYGEFSIRPRQGRLEPVPLHGIHGLKHAGIDRDEREALGLHFKDGAALQAGTDAELVAQAGRFLDVALSAGPG